MKIVNKRNRKLLTFQELTVGDVFRDEDGDIIMKTYSSNGFNAVGLNTNRLYNLSHDYEVVEVLNATLTIED